MSFLQLQPSSSVNSNESMASINFSILLTDYLKKYYCDPFDELIFLCVGTDRSTGDCLGPLIGHKLSNSMLHYDNVFIHGTLDDPVHAKNLQDKIDEVNKKYKNPFVVAIDACLGKTERVGFVTIGYGSLKPGAGVNKKLPEVGNIHIMGIVNLGGYMEYLVLQNTRLSTVMKMADTVVEGIKYSIWKLNKQQLLS